ncbi:hypothetical protein CAPTEDRAFT_46375, partial [Capitella teleta]
SQRSSLDSDQSKHHCPFCEKVYRFKQNLRDHINVHTGKRPHICKHCGASFTHLSNMCAHFARTEEGKFQCPYCEKAYNFKHTLKDHINKHTGLRPHVCKHCGDSFTHLASLCNHIKRRHEEKIPQVRNYSFKCKLCGHLLKARKSLYEHIDSHLGRKPYSCTHCGDSFTHKSTLHNHVR